MAYSEEWGPSYWQKIINRVCILSFALQKHLVLVYLTIVFGLNEGRKVVIFFKLRVFLGARKAEGKKRFFSDPLLVKNKLYIMLFKRTVYRSTLQWSVYTTNTLVFIP